MLRLSNRGAGSEEAQHQTSPLSWRTAGAIWDRSGGGYNSCSKAEGSCCLLHFMDEGVKALLKLPTSQFPGSPLHSPRGHWCQPYANIPRRCAGCRRLLAVPSKRSCVPSLLGDANQRAEGRGMWSQQRTLDGDPELHSPGQASR